MGHSETVAIVELGPAESAPVLKRYVTGVPITRPFFDAGPESLLEAFEAEAWRRAHRNASKETTDTVPMSCSSVRRGMETPGTPIFLHMEPSHEWIVLQNKR